MKIALIDDEPEELDFLSQIIKKHLLDFAYNLQSIDTFLSGDAFFADWESGMYDIIFLDIYLKDQLGIDVARKIRETDSKAHLIFCTTSNEFASESYEVNAYSYLRKPFSEEKVTSVLKQLNKKIHEPGYGITLPDGQKLLLRNIIFTEYCNHVVNFYNKKGGNIQTRISHGELEKLLCRYSFFYCCSKGMIVNFYEVASYNREFFLMNNGSRVPISRRKVKDVQAAYTRFRFEQLRQEVCE
ncbi:MAG: LytTR family DNA-binding domain-containing protein [Clostridium sp.]|nr:LytTR family DNA-binding domain-containing protein [Clostridium sp.]